MSRVMNAFFVVLTFEDTLTRQLPTERVPFDVTLAAPPVFDGSKHDAPDIGGAISSVFTVRGMMKDTTDDSVQSSPNVNILVIPALHQLWDRPLDNLGSYPTRRFIKDVREVVLGKH